MGWILRLTLQEKPQYLLTNQLSHYMCQIQDLLTKSAEDHQSVWFKWKCTTKWNLDTSQWYNNYGLWKNTKNIFFKLKHHIFSFSFFCLLIYNYRLHTTVENVNKHVVVISLIAHLNYHLSDITTDNAGFIFLFII